MRAFTATSSQGLAYVHELLHWASEARLPIVMAEVNRALAPGWNIWTDQTDSYRQTRKKIQSDPEDVWVGLTEVPHENRTA